MGRVFTLLMTKADLIEACQELLSQRLQRIDEAMALSREAAESDTKSSAGDKFETTRAMMHAALERLTAQRNEVLKLKEGLFVAAQSMPGKNIGLGSVVKTSIATYFVASAIGKVSVGAKDVFVLSPASPLGKLLLEKVQGDKVLVGNHTHHIEEVY